MGYIFDYNAARQYDSWYKNPENRFVADLEDQLVLRLLEPVRGERVLDIGCGTGRHLLMFSELGLDITGLDASPHMLGIAQRKLGHRVQLYEGVAEDLPFEDNSFDIVTIITTLEFVDDVKKALEEACRVAEKRIFVGVLNRYSIKAIERRVKGIFSESIYNRARFFSVWQIKRDVQEVLGKVPVGWGTALHLPTSLMKYTQHLERWRHFQRFPFGCFIGVGITLVPRYRTQNVPIGYVEQPTGVAPWG